MPTAPIEIREIRERDILAKNGHVQMSNTPNPISILPFHTFFPFFFLSFPLFFMYPRPRIAFSCLPPPSVTESIIFIVISPHFILSFFTLNNSWFRYNNAMAEQQKMSRSKLMPMPIWQWNDNVDECLSFVRIKGKEKILPSRLEARRFEGL